MKITKLVLAPKVPFDLDGHIMGRNGATEIVHLHLKPGQIVEKHVNEFDVFFYVLEGKALLLSEKGSEMVCKDQCVHIEGGTQRGFNNTSVAGFKVLAIKMLG